MIQSMTGFGQAQAEFEGYSVLVEIRTLNSKGTTDIHCRIPREFIDFEFDLRSLLSEKLVRGKINVKLEIKYSSGLENSVSINKELFQLYYKELKALIELQNDKPKYLYQSILTLPDVVNAKEPDSEEKKEQWEQIRQLVAKACDECISFRIREGQALMTDFENNLKRMEELLESISPFENARLQTLREKWQERLKELQGASYDANRLEQELVFYAEKLDINEEKTRLKQHIVFFGETLKDNAKSDKGKKLSFIAQEMNREINTIGSKANQFEIQRIVVDLKEEQDKLKEQLANIL